MIKKKPTKEQLLASYSMKMMLIATIIIAVWKKEWLWVIGGFIGIFIGFIPSFLHHDIKITLPWQIDFLIATVAALNMFGVLLNAYHIIPGYGEMTQFLTSILVAFFAFAIIFILDEYWDGLMMDKHAMAFVVVVTTMASCVILEFVKWFKLFGLQQRTVEEVLLSLLIGTIGGIMIAVVGVNLIKKGKFDDMTEELGKQLDAAIKSRRKRKEDVNISNRK